jgi:hypothetical protein
MPYFPSVKLPLPPTPHAFSLTATLAFLAALPSGAVFPGCALAFSDNFDDGNLDGWVLFDPMSDLGIAAPAEVTFPDGGVRIRGFVPAIPDAGPARVFVYREEAFTTFFAAFDVVDWDNGINMAFGFLARAGNIGVGQTEGYVMNYDPNQTGSRPGGQLQINSVTGELPDTVAAANITLIDGRSYRWVFQGQGDELRGSVYDMEDLTQPIAEVLTDQGWIYPSGNIGLFNFYRGDETDPVGIPDFTFDNFFVEATNPNPALWPAVPHPLPGTAQVTARTPENGANFHPAASGIAFTATTMGVGAVAPGDVKLSLNGADVTAGLALVQAGDDVTATYSGLEPNQIYDAVVTVGDPAAGGSVNRWTFDTIESAKLAGADGVGEFREVECEDYDYADGEFQNTPPPSGFGMGGVVNGGGVGYYDLSGTPDVDYFDVDISADALNDYRFLDGVGLRPGSDDFQPVDELPTDTVRPKYAATGAPDYEIHRTEATEWTNYTRVFETGEYRVLLRVASRQAQDVILQDVTGGGSAELGRFEVPNLVSPLAHRYIPLTDGGGMPLTLALDGQRTLRLLMGGTAGDFSTRYTLYLNYLLLIPEGGTPEVPAPLITSVERIGQTVVLGWTSVEDATYAVDYSRSLGAAPDTWSEIAAVVATGGSSTYTDDDPVRNAAPDGQYRVRVKE